MSILGIKIWWFKRRLDFVQTPTRNIGADKDKRQSQEVSDSVATHGVFRKRNEDELEIFERPRQLPPIRIQARSISRTALITLPQTEPMNLRPIEVVQELPDAVFKDRNIDGLESDLIIKPIRTEEEEQHINDTSKTSRNTPVVHSSVKTDWTFEEVKPKVISETSAEITTTIERQSFEINEFEGLSEIKLKEQPKLNAVEVIGSNVQLDSSVLYYKDLETVKSLNEQDNFVTESAWNNVMDSEPTYAIEVHSDVRASDTPVYDEEVFHTPNQEFKKIRHSFQHHEGHFLELNESFNQILHSPTGYGKSIDEDWENFEDLIKTTMLEQKPKDVDTKLITYFDHSCKPSNQIAAYVQNIEELYDNVSDNDNAITTTQNSPSILKVHELNCKSTEYKFPYRKAKKLKAQQKVTFDVHTEEYYLTESDTESEVGTPNTFIPTPMQRTSNIQYNIEHINNDEKSNEREPSSTAFHYNTQILLDSPIESRDSYCSNGTQIDLPSPIIQPAPRHKLRQSAES